MRFRYLKVEQAREEIELELPKRTRGITGCSLSWATFPPFPVRTVEVGVETAADGVSGRDLA